MHGSHLNGLVIPLCLTKDIYVQLSSKLLHNQRAKQLLDLIFLPSTALPCQTGSDLWGLYKGKVIGNIQLQRQGVSQLDVGGMAASRWWSPLCRLLSPTTRDWVIHDYSSFRVGDRLDDRQLESSQNRLNNLTYLKQAEIGIELSKSSSDTVDLLVTTQDAFPIKLDLASSAIMVSHQNLGGWGHAFINRFRTISGWAMALPIGRLTSKDRTSRVSYST